MPVPALVSCGKSGPGWPAWTSGWGQRFWIILGEPILALGSGGLLTAERQERRQNDLPGLFWLESSLLPSAVRGWAEVKHSVMPGKEGAAALSTFCLRQLGTQVCLPPEEVSRGDPWIPDSPTPVRTCIL